VETARAKAEMGGICLALLAACLMVGPAASATDMIPCAIGNRWEFDCVKLVRGTISMQGKSLADLYDPQQGTTIYEITGVDANAKPVVYDYQESTFMKSVAGRSETEKVQIKLTSEDGVLRVVSTYRETSGEDGPEKQVYNPPLTYFMRDLAETGKGWDVGTMRDGDTFSPASARGAGRETVIVPAGTFKDCLKVIFSSDQLTGSVDIMGKKFNITSGKNRGVYWIADGVGIVKELEVSTMSAEADGPEGSKFLLEGATCVVSELKPGYLVHK